MHSANRAKQRLRAAQEARLYDQQLEERNRKIEAVGGCKKRLFGGHQNGSSLSRQVLASTAASRSKSLDRKSVNAMRKVRDVRPMSPAQHKRDHLHLLPRGNTPNLASSTCGPGSDSGLSGLDGAEANSMMHHHKKSSSPEMENSIVDSGRRSQSLEILSDDLRSMSLSTPSSPSPRPPTAASAASEAKLSTGSHRGHVHFLSSSAENGNTPNNADIVRNMVEEFGAMHKSTSIPVHLTVSSNNEVELPPRLRPHNPVNSSRGSDLEHEPDCASYKKKWSSAQTLPLSSNTNSVNNPVRGRGLYTPQPATPTGETVSSLQKKKFRIHHNGYSSLPRNSSSKMAGNSNMDRMSQLQDQKVARSKSSVSLSHDTPRRPTSAASSVASAKRASPRPGSRQGHGSGASHKTMNASMSIWQIQKELKRGEMVQGVLSLGSLGRPSFGSRIREREEETCICAPVVIGGKNGHMDWRRM